MTLSLILGKVDYDQLGMTGVIQGRSAKQTAEAAFQPGKYECYGQY